MSDINMSKAMESAVAETETKLIHMVFTRGHCHSLALTLQRKIGGELVIAHDGSCISHVALMVGNKVLDIEGLHNLSAFRERWGELEEISRRKFMTQYRDDFHFEPDPKLAEGAADALMKLHKINPQSQGAESIITEVEI